MNRLALALVVCLAVPLAPASAAAQTPPPVTELTGRIGNTTYYSIKVPANWNGDLVIWNHGYVLDPNQQVPPLGPLESYQLSQGYAVAASSYRQTGWATFRTDIDLKNLYDLFKRTFGEPNQVILNGFSLGGLVTIQAIEQAKIGNVVGAFTACGALAGSRNWDGALDARLVYDAVCGQVPGAFIPGGAQGLPRGSNFSQQDLGAALNACFGVLQPGGPSPAQFQRLALVTSVLQIPVQFVGTVMAYATFGIADLVHDPGKLSGQVGMGNVGVDYGDPFINQAIERVAPNKGAQNKLLANYTPTGDTRGTKIVSLHTDKDGLVVVENEKEYADVAPADAFTTAVVREATPSHCGFTAAELVAGWESLRMWLAGAPQPTPASLQGTCLAISATQPALGACRIDPTYVIQDIDTRIRPRP